MADPWHAQEFGTDPVELIAQVAAAQEAFPTVGAAPRVRERQVIVDPVGGVP